ncbi:MAG TPA: M20/M25/M40 family metallo-hydrolase [Longimicrobiales bacterium]|nr:M20/M25/M40 family metallo-hydrolase [Longimicrobiales bacterium]
MPRHEHPRHLRRGIATLALLALATPAAAPAQQAGLEAARSHRQAHGSAILEEYAELLRIPNVAADSVNIRRNAAWIRAALAARGVDARLLTLPGAPPVVYGELRAPGASRTLILYVHYDGQPVDTARWTTSPWEPALYSASLEDGGRPIPFPAAGEPIDPEWRIYARSAGDDKAPIAALLAALDGLRAAGVAPTSNLKFFFEGEEEAGSPSLLRFLESYPDEAEGDAWLFLDGPVHQSRAPQLFFGVRGYSGLDVTVYGANRYLHSGHYGNWAPNPALMLSRLLASMKDEDGHVRVAGFYDSVEPLDAAARAAVAAYPDFDAALRRELGLARSEAEPASYIERMLIPSLNIRGMESASVGATVRNIVPTTATASIDVRLVKGNDPDAMLDRVEAHIRGQGYHIVREEPDAATRLAHPKIARVVRSADYPAARTAMDLPIARSVIAAARAASPEPLVLTPTLGGSLPLYYFTDLLSKPMVGVPIANHDNNQHAPDENLRLANLWYGIDLMGALMTMAPEPPTP